MGSVESLLVEEATCSSRCWVCKKKFLDQEKCVTRLWTGFHTKGCFLKTGVHLIKGPYSSKRLLFCTLMRVDKTTSVQLAFLFLFFTSSTRAGVILHIASTPQCRSSVSSWWSIQTYVPRFLTARIKLPLRLLHSNPSSQEAAARRIFQSEVHFPVWSEEMWIYHLSWC